MTDQEAAWLAQAIDRTGGFGRVTVRVVGGVLVGLTAVSVSRIPLEPSIAGGSEARTRGPAVPRHGRTK